MISKSYVHKVLEIKRLQNAPYGRLAVGGTLAPEAARGFEPHLAKPDASRVPNSLLLFCVSKSEASTVLSGRQPHNPLEHPPKGSWVLVTDHTGNLVNGKR